MANPQKENGHLDLALEIVEKLQSFRIPGEQWLVLWVVLRKTWGWHKLEDKIPLSQFVISTGLKRSNVVRCLHGLVSKRILHSIKDDTSPSIKTDTYRLTEITSYSFNKNYDEWLVSKRIPITPSIKTDTGVVSKQSRKASKPSISSDTLKRNLVFKEKSSSNGNGKSEHYRKETVFTRSPLCHFSDFKVALHDWPEEKAQHYFDLFIEKEQLHPGKYKYANWALAARTWDRKQPFESKKVSHANYTPETGWTYT